MQTYSPGNVLGAQPEHVLDMQLPLMFVEPHRSLSTMYLSASSLERIELVRNAVEALGVTPALLYTYRDATQPQPFSSILVLDHTNAQTTPDRINAAVAQVPGITVRNAGAPSPSLVAFERNTLNMAGTPVAVIAQPFLGDTHKRLIESLGDRAATVLFQAGESAGNLAAAGIPALVSSLGLTLTPQLIRQRFLDLQVFGWATIVALDVDDQFVGHALLADDFTVGPWQGKAPSSVCHWIRGFLSGALSSLTGHPLQVSEPECQAKGDPHCRMTFRRA
ncbi:MAG TPA: 4-vinyl reductase [Ktedonobacterales bacterium]